VVAWIAIVLCLFIACSAVAPCSADVSSMYPRSELDNAAPRLTAAVTKIYDLGVKPHLTPDELSRLRDFGFHFPLPSPSDEVLNFYANDAGSKPIVVMPILSLKVVEDMATAYAWLYQNGMSLGTIDLYFAMLRHKRKVDLPEGKYPPLLATLGIPTNALEDPKIDQLSLSFRNQAFAFVLVHELGHILHKHKGYDVITKAQARADEAEADRFALDVLARTQTAPLGAILFFQAQVYSHPHRGEFVDRQTWQQYLLTASTHPLTVDRIAAMGDYIEGPLVRGRVKETSVWSSIVVKLRAMIRVMEDEPLQRCMARVAAAAVLSVLKPRKHIPREEFERICGKN
jgi:Peptidase family M48